MNANLQHIIDTVPFDDFHGPWRKKFNDITHLVDVDLPVSIGSAESPKGYNGNRLAVVVGEMPDQSKASYHNTFPKHGLKYYLSARFKTPRFTLAETFGEWDSAEKKAITKKLKEFFGAGDTNDY